MSEEVGYFKSSIGLLKIKLVDNELVSIKFVDEKSRMKKSVKYSKLMKDILLQLEEYFKQDREVFDLPLNIRGTDFQRDVYKALININYGEVITYKKLAEISGHDKAYRAVGTAMKNNKLPIIIPCHRVIKTDGQLGKYNGGNWRKKELLKLEGLDIF